jgi:hypothetical protein
MVHGVFALMNICQIDVLSALRLQRQSCQQMVHGVFALMNICQILVLFALRATALVMSADGSWVFAYEHLPRLAVLSLALAAVHVGRWFMGVCTHEHICRSIVLSVRLPQRQSCQQMVHGVCTHEHLTHRCSLALRLLVPVIVSRWFVDVALMNI